MKTSDILGSGIIFCISIAAYFKANSFPLGTDTFPKAILVALMLLASAQMILAFRKHPPDESSIIAEEFNLLRMGSMAGLLVLYAVLIPIIGYYIVTPLFLFTSMLILGRRRIVSVLTVSVSVTLIIYLIFRLFLFVPVPMGFLGM